MFNKIKRINLYLYLILSAIVPAMVRKMDFSGLNIYERGGLLLLALLIFGSTILFLITLAEMITWLSLIIGFFSFILFFPTMLFFGLILPEKVLGLPSEYGPLYLVFGFIMGILMIFLVKKETNRIRKRPLNAL
jgi:hypothetical protein